MLRVKTDPKDGFPIGIYYKYNSFESVSIRPLVIVLHSVLIGSRWVMASPNEVAASRFLYEMF